jgi:hypothetical protein
MRWSSSTSEIPRRWLLLDVAVIASLAGIVIYAVGTLRPLQNAAIDEGFALEGARPARQTSSSSPLIIIR